jgi:2-haloacid dehalogenase
MSVDEVAALTFDVFGTVVDWRGTIARELRGWFGRRGIERDWEGVADRWRALYQPAMEEVRRGRRPWTRLDDLHRDNLRVVLDEFGLAGLNESEIEHLNRAWHRLDPWPDALDGLTRLRRRFILCTADLLGLQPARCMMVAAHNDDLQAARALGFGAAFVARPTEHGPQQTRDLRAEHAFDVVAADFRDLADRLGC